VVFQDIDPSLSVETNTKDSTARSPEATTVGLMNS